MITPIQQATALIQSGFASQGQGDVAQAEAHYQAALRLVPEHPTALQLLGLLASRRGDVAAAEDLMRRSLRKLPAQPHVWNNLGNLLDEAGRHDEALSCFDQALKTDARYADAHYNRARVLLTLRRLPEAAASVDQALAASPQASAALLHLQAQIQGEQGELQAAAQTLETALVQHPDKPALWHTLGTLLQRGHRYAQALAAHERARALGLDAADAHYNRGNSLQSLGRNQEAQAAYNEALRRDPLHELALYDLARLRWRMGDAHFDADLKRAAQTHPHSALPLSIQAQLLWRAERYQAAAEVYRLALQRAPAVAGFHDGLGRCLVRLGEVDAGLAAQARAVALAPADVDIRTQLAASLLSAGRIDAAEREAAQACTQAPHNQYAWALRELAWRLMGDARAAWLNDVHRLVQVIDLPPPTGYRDMASFNQALQIELEALHKDSEAPVDQTLRRGTQTLGDIFEQGHPLVDALKRQIAQALDRYIAGLPTEAAHPFLSRRSEGWRFADSWSSRLRDQGFHTHHVHPHGWISSAYYVAVPDVCEDIELQQGWLQFGLPDIAVGPGLQPLQPLQPLLQVQPKPGRLALFPSMMWHGTRPFSSPQPRLTIAFDVLPTPPA